MLTDYSTIVFFETLIRMSFLHILSFLFSVTLCDGKSAVDKEAYYTKQTSDETTSTAKLIECGVKYIDNHFGVFKVNADRTECTAEPWFDNQSTEDGYTYYIKDRMTLNLDPPIHLLHPLIADLVNRYWIPFPSPVSANSILEIYFTSKIPFRYIFFDLRGGEQNDIINRVRVSGSHVEMITVLTNVQLNLNPRIRRDNVPFVEERMYKVTYTATESTLQLFVDDQLLITKDDFRQPTDITNLKFSVYETEAWLHKINFFVN